MTGAQRYAYRAARADGAVETGSLSAPDLSAVAAVLAQRGFLLIEATAQSAAAARKRPIPPTELAIGLRMLGDLLEAGLPMSRVFAAFAEVAPVSWREAIPHLRQSIREGLGLAAALGAAPVEFPALVIGLVQAGEAGNGTAAAVRHAAGLAEETAATRTAVRAALAYPIVLASAGAGAIAVLVTVVLPRFATILGDLGQVLPPATRFVLAAATVARAAIAPVAICLVLGLGALRGWTATPHGRRRWHAMLLHLPLLGTIRFASATARATATLSTLLRTGVPVRQAMRFAARATGDAEIEHRVLGALAHVGAGGRMAVALRDTRALTPLGIRLVAAGEDSGRMVDMLHHAATLEQARADRITRTAVRVLEPSLVLVFAIVIAGVSVALLQAIYSVRPT